MLKKKGFESKCTIQTHKEMRSRNSVPSQRNMNNITLYYLQPLPNRA